ncbi:MAG: acyl-CoA dehydrogenase C-terminal domain-containing protein [Alphaproteobacteria bacterium]|nr:acyl-CoA dehydrogenase C-terminal domain-containing protein [Alphaproteobacteria bacterium]MCB9691138.1 acyl-CoA dehydrogenase C-terminal domain-containing protein [Alphaproteobacteria bacterium]
MYTPPIADIRFNLEVFGYEQDVASLPAFADFDLETAMSLLEEYSKYCVEVLHPLNKSGDTTGVRFDPADSSVTMPEGFKEAYAGYCENGFGSIPWNAEHGGMGAPFALSTLASEVMIACNKAFSMCPGLTAGLIDALEAYGTPAQKEVYLSKLISGEWSGTMCLTEPQCGTDLGLVSTVATPVGDHFELTGTKIWITFGEHDLTENIVHLVLARLPDAPRGIKGISAFLVPKFLEDGSRNPVFCGGTDHKMGIHASPTCVINLEGAKGWLVGEPHKGMRSMFVMMNAARLNVGIEGVALAEAAYQASLKFAKDRRQSRALDAKKQDREHAADNILVHPDVRRMLLDVKSTTEGLRGLVAWIALNYDVMHHSTDEAVQQKAEDLVALLTPIIKSFGSERGFFNVSTAMQVMGGAGYTADWPVEHYLRDVRIAMIYEGTNHIQALDLVGRKLMMGGGRLMRVFAGEITDLIKSCADDARMAPFVEPLKAESKRLNATTMEMGGMASADHEVMGAVASAYLNQFALVTLAYVWARQAKAVIDRPEDDPQRRSKLQLARYYMELVLPEAAMYAQKVKAGKGAVVDIDVDLL